MPDDEPLGAWGAWATVGFGLLAMGAMVLTQTIVVMIFLGILLANTPAVPGKGLPIDGVMERLMNDPLMLAVSVLVSLPVTLGALWIVIKLRRGRRFAEYLAVRRFRVVQFFLWAAALAAVLFCGEWLIEAKGDTSGEEFMRGLMQSGKFLAPLIAALTLGAPIGEELLFRGFMYRGLAESNAGWGLAILVPNLFWVMLHVQYEWPTLAVLFAMGIVLGLARRYSGSVMLPLLLHLISNSVSTASSMWTE